MKFILTAAAILLIAVSGCKTYEGDFVEKSEAELAGMERKSVTANQAFIKENYSGAEKILRELVRERTVSRPLYQLELLSVLLMTGKHDEAHALMESMHQDFELLFDDRMTEKALSVWHGEVNKVYKGDAHERATFYVFMALSCIRKGDYEAAVGYVKNGLLADADSRKEKAVEDYAMLYYLGFFSCMKLGEPQKADEFLQWMFDALGYRREISDDESGAIREKCIADFNKKAPNVILVVWAGTPPTVSCVGEYKEIRAVIRGSNPFDLMSVSVNNITPVSPVSLLGDIDYQATFRGGRIMDNVLADKAAAKKAMEVSRNLMFIAGSVCFVVAKAMPEATTQLALFGAGAGCYIAGVGFHIVGSLMNPQADGRYWKNLPGQLYMLPMHLEPGDYQLMFAGYRKSDITGMLMEKITVGEGDGIQVIHLPMLTQGMNAGNAYSVKFKKEVENVRLKSSISRMDKELK